MSERDDTTPPRVWVRVQRIVLVSASAAGVLTLAIVQAADRTMSPQLVLLLIVVAVFAGGLLGAMVATTVLKRRGIPVREPRTRARFVVILGLSLLLLGLVAFLLVPVLGLHSPYPGATLFAIFPLLGLVATEVAFGLTMRSGD
jgi:hypothetical protein